MVDDEISRTLVFFVNGKKIEDDNVEPEWTLLYYLRTKLRLCGTKLGCGEGGCGACTVMVSRYDRLNHKEVNLPVNACLAPVCSMHGLAVTTVEGIGSTKTKLHPVQERIAKAHGTQCGFCTPGMVMSMYALLRNTPKPNMADLEEAFQGNLCRCTGYRPILQGYQTFTEEWEISQNGKKLVNGNGSCAMGKNCCKLTSNGTVHEEEVLFQKEEFAPYDETQELIFPPELKLSQKYDNQFLQIKGKNVTWYRPTNLSQILQLKSEHPHAKIVVGNTEVGVEVKFKQMQYPVIVQPSKISEMLTITGDQSGIKIGAAVTLTDLGLYLQQQITELPEYKTRIFREIVEMLKYFAGKQIRSVGALGGNIMTGSPISDMIPILMASKVILEVQSEENGVRKIEMNNKFFTGYRKTVVKPNEVLTGINIPYTTENQYFFAYKQARRRDDDIAIVNIAMNVYFKHKTDIIENISVAYGGMSATTVTAAKTESLLKGQRWNKDTLEMAYSCLIDDLPLNPSAPGGMIQYRKSLCLSLFYKGFLTISEKLHDKLQKRKMDERCLSAITSLSNEPFNFSQHFTVVPKTQEKVDAVHRPIVHVSSYKQATGEAIYCDDMPFFENELYMALVLSTRPHAKILSIDATEALSMSGVEGFFSEKDMESDKQNSFGLVASDEKIFYSTTVTSKGQIIGVVVAVDQETAKKAATKVKVEYEDLFPVIVSMEDAIEHESYFPVKKFLESGDIDRVMKEAPRVLEGECRMGGQEHFYLETQCVIAVPKMEDYEMEIFSSSQNPTDITRIVSNLLGVPQNKIITRVKRIGGGFGGKQWKAALLAAPAAFVASKMNRPVRIMLDRDEDMVSMAGRHPYMFKYKVAVDYDDRILGMDIKSYSNCGYSLDTSHLVMEKALSHCQNAYNIPAVRFDGYLCKTNLPSSTAFRGFGGPQGMFCAESIISDIANHLQTDATKLRALNLYRDGDVTFHNQKLENCTIRKCWDECIQSSNYHERSREVQQFNKDNKYKKRGLSIIPTMFGVAFGSDADELFLNQGGALVLVYTDGSVLLSHGGVEMGQGLLTKMIQVASRALGVSVEKIHTTETATNTVPNTSPTAASLGSDLNGMAVMDACMKIKNRLRPYMEANPKGTWEDWVRKAYFDRVSLAATGFYKMPDVGYDPQTGVGLMFNYFTYGVCCTEVEIDALTGDHQVLRTDIVMDLGESLNPAIDIGQIEGSYLQGYGLFVMEEMMYSPDGDVLTKGPGTYKIPSFSSMPKVFNVSLLKGSTNPRAVYSSKAVGEPPLFLAASAFFAIRQAITAARAENGYGSKFKLNAPATAERIRMACEDSITSRFEAPVSGTYKPWNVVI